MKRALALLLIASMISTSTVYAADNPDTFSDVSEYTGEYDQGENEDTSGNDGADDYFCEDGNTDYESESSEGSPESDSGTESEDSDAGYSNEAGSSDTEGSISDSDTAGDSENVTDSGESSGESFAKSETPDTADGTEGKSETSSESESLKEDAASDTKEVKSENASALNDGNAADSKSSEDVKNADVTDSNSVAGESSSDSNSLSEGSVSDSDEDVTVGSGAEDGKNSPAAQDKNASNGVLPVVPNIMKNATAGENTTTTRIAIMSDIHYVTDQLISEIGRENLKNAAMTEFRLMEEIDAILNAALEEASASSPDALLICGDLVSNGELLGARALAAKLKAAKEKSGFANTGFYVVNGNHDINNSYAVDFTGDKSKPADRVQPSDFKEVFSGLGYGDDDHWAGGSHSVYVPVSDDPSAVANHGGLSYAADIADGITLIVLDTGIYRTDENGESMYNNAQKTAGYVSDDLLAWAANQAKEAKAKGNLVLAMSHHGLLPHYDTDLEDQAAWYMDSFRVPNWEKVADTLADAGVSAVLTGHTHANDIAAQVSKNNNVLYDVETAALCAYPCLWREFDIVTAGEGDEKSYTISIDTTYINDHLEADTSSWSFTIGGRTKTFDEDYNSNLQDYAYEKSGITEEILDDMAMYMVKNTLSDILAHEGGLAGYLKEQLNIPEDKSLGQYAAESIGNLISGFTGFTQEINNALFKGSISIENATKEGDANPTLNITADLSGRTEHGKATVDMSYLPTAVDELAVKAQTKLVEGEWLKNPYASNPLLDDVKKLIQNAVVPAFSSPLKEGDPESTAVKLFNDGWQAFSIGDEGLADDEKKAKWEEARELIGGDTLAGKITQGLWNEAIKMNTPAYPALSELFSQRIVPEGKNGIITVTTDNPGDYLLPAITNLLGLNSLDTLSSIIRTASTLNMVGLGNPIPASVVKPLTQKVVELHKVMTTDNNIKHDNIWDIQIVHFDANGGSVSQTHAMTVEDHKLTGLPTPDEREDYVFDGWFTEETGGTQVTAEDDMTGIGTLYAHWTYVGKEEEEEEEPTPVVPDEKPEPVQPEEKEEPEPEKKDESVSPVIPPKTEEIKTENTESDSREPAVELGLHRYFVSRKALHDKIFNVEYSDNDHAKFCEALVKALKEGETVFNMGEWLSLDAEAVAAIEACDKDVTLEYVGQGIGFRFVIPAKAKISRFADEHGAVCVVCLAEYYGYERIKT